MAATARAFPDYYAILGVLETATEQEIREAYKKEAIRWHPDRNPSPLSEKRFQEVADAYYVLSDRGRRAQYDKARKNRGPFRSDGGRSDANQVFGDVFEDLLRPEVEDPKWFYSPLGLISGAVMGYIFGNLSGAVVGGMAGKFFGSMRDNKDKSVMEIFMELDQAAKLAILQAIAHKLLVRRST